MVLPGPTRRVILPTRHPLCQVGIFGSVTVAQRNGDTEAAEFFSRNRTPRLVIGVVMSVALVVAYLFGIQSYRSGLSQALPVQNPAAGGVSLVIVPEGVAPDEQELPVRVLVFPSAELLDADGLLKRALEVRIQPALSGQSIVFPAGKVTAPQSAVLPTAGTVQYYPFDTYVVAAEVQVTAGVADAAEPVPTQMSLFFRVPGWSAQGTSVRPSVGVSSAVMSTELWRNGSTKSIALLLLLLMVVLATVAILVTGSVTRGGMALELSVASWLTALLFALIPLRGFFPGDPPLGSWMDILVFFWVELILMVSVAAVVTTILMRARDVRRHPVLTSDFVARSRALPADGRRRCPCGTPAQRFRHRSASRS